MRLILLKKRDKRFAAVSSRSPGALASGEPHPATLKLQGNIMKINTTLISLVCVALPSVASAECYRTTNGGTYCTSANSTAPTIQPRSGSSVGSVYGQVQRGVQNGWDMYQQRPAEVQVIQGVKNAAACAASQGTAFRDCIGAATSGVRGAQAAGQATLDASAGYYQMQQNRYNCGSYWTCMR